MSGLNPEIPRAGSRAELDSRLAMRLGAVGQRLRRYVLVEGVAWIVGFLVVAGIVQFVIDYGLRGIRWSMRAGLLAIILIGAVYVLWRFVLRPLRAPAGFAEIAKLIERRYPQLGSVLISAVRFTKGDVGSAQANSEALMASVVNRAARQAERVDFDAVLSPHRAKRGAFVLVGGLVFVVILGLALPETTAIWFSRNVLLRETPWPRQTHLVVDVEGRELVAARGDDVVIEARAEGVQPRAVEIFVETASGQQSRETMVTIGSRGSHRYRYTVKKAEEDFTFYLRGGDDITDIYTARLLERPRVVASEMKIHPPAYTRLEDIVLGDGQRVTEVLPGTRIAIEIETKQDVQRATLMAGTEVVAEATGEADHFSVEVSPSRTHTYHFALQDKAELENRRPLRFAVRVVRDEPPRVRLRLEGVGDMVTPEAVLPMELSSEDKYGLASTELAYQILREQLQGDVILLPTFTQGAKRFVTSVHWPVASAGVVAGDRLTLLATATDFDDVSGPNIGQSAEASLRVVTREELLAEFARREQEQRLNLERLLDNQERIRGRLLTARSRFPDEVPSAELTAALAPLERQQRSLAGSVNVMRQQFDRILTELKVNRLDTKDETRRLQTAIINPLTELAKRDLITAADAIRQWSRDGSGGRAATADKEQAVALTKMRAILASMIQWEGYHEVVTMLREIIRLQDELSEESKDALLRDAEDVFEP